MKKCSLLPILLLSAGTLCAQHVTIGLDKMNVAYIGVNNPISVASDIYGCDQLIVKVDDKVLEGKECEYNFMPTSAGTAEISIYCKHGQELKKIGGEIIRVKRIPDFLVSVGGKTDGYISAAKLFASDGPECKLPPTCEYDLSFTIISFTITIYRAASTDNIFQRTNTGTKFDDPTKDILRRLKRNDVVELSNIRAQGPDGSRKLQNVSLKILN